MPLTEAFKLWFPKCRAPSLMDKPLLASELTVVNLRKLHGVNVKWIPTLGDHPKYLEKTKTIETFRHKICLKSYLELEIQEMEPQKLTR